MHDKVESLTEPEVIKLRVVVFFIFDGDDYCEPKGFEEKRLSSGDTSLQRLLHQAINS